MTNVMNVMNVMNVTSDPRACLLSRHRSSALLTHQQAGTPILSLGTNQKSLLVNRYSKEAYP